MVIYSDPPREKKQQVQVSDYEQAVERLKKLKAPWWALKTVAEGDQITYFASLGDPNRNQNHGYIQRSGSCALDAACAAIDQFRTAMVAGEEKEPEPEYSGKATFNWSPSVQDVNALRERAIKEMPDWAQEMPRRSEGAFVPYLDGPRHVCERCGQQCHNSVTHCQSIEGDRHRHWCSKECMEAGENRRVSMVPVDTDVRRDVLLSGDWAKLPELCTSVQAGI